MKVQSPNMLYRHNASAAAPQKKVQVKEQIELDDTVKEFG